MRSGNAAVPFDRLLDAPATLDEFGAVDNQLVAGLGPTDAQLVGALGGTVRMQDQRPVAVIENLGFSATCAFSVHNFVDTTAPRHTRGRKRCVGGLFRRSCD
ncbi:hypothetical protein [Rhodococcus sp. NPDC058521]|uniref:hypothetical protein n=1 Tax=Rhodococcus sp. NPDC058521 TaxID=3346536 RepID=UPI003657909E